MNRFQGKGPRQGTHASLAGILFFYVKPTDIFVKGESNQRFGVSSVFYVIFLTLKFNGIHHDR